MCVKCLLLQALAAADASFAAEPEQQPTNQSAAMGTDSGPGQPELSYDDRQDRAYGQVELDQARADVNVANAEAVRKLAHAAQILSNINENSAVRRIVGMIEHLVPAIPEAEPAPMQEQAVDPDRDVYIVFNGATGTGKTLLSSIVHKALLDQDFDANFSPDGVDTICVRNPAQSIRNRDEAHPITGPVPDDIETLAQQLANQLGIEVRVASFPRK